MVAWKWDKIKAYFVGKYRLYCRQKKQFWRSMAVFWGFVLLALAGWGALCLAGVLDPTKYTCLYFLLGGCTVRRALLPAGTSTQTIRSGYFFDPDPCLGLVYAALLPKATIVSWMMKPTMSGRCRCPIAGPPIIPTRTIC